MKSNASKPGIFFKNLSGWTILIFSSIVLSCSGNHKNVISEPIDQQKNTENKQQYSNDPHQQTSLSFKEEEIVFSTWFGESSEPENLNYSLLIANKRLSDDNLTDLMKELNISREGELKTMTPLGLVIYSNKHYLPKDDFSMTGVKGAMLFFLDKRKKLFAKSFINKDHSLREIKALSSRVKNIAFDDIYSLAELIPTGKTEQISAMVFFNEDSSYRSSWYAKNYERVINEYKRIINYRRDDCEKPCRFPCDGIIKGSQCTFQEKPGGLERYICTCFCAARNAISQVTRRGLKTNFSEKDLYSLRDDFLVNSKKGIKYIDYDYELSSYFKDKMELGKIIEIVSLGNEIIPNLRSLREKKGRDSTAYLQKTHN